MEPLAGLGRSRDPDFLEEIGVFLRKCNETRVNPPLFFYTQSMDSLTAGKAIFGKFKLCQIAVSWFPSRL
jgi:hypothetical protein